MSDENLNTEGPTEGVTAPAGGVDLARDAARAAEGAESGDSDFSMSFL